MASRTTLKSHMPNGVLKLAGLLLGSGACALVYQTAWLRELRLVFGASTAASAAVLAIFMGGLGLGGALFGRLADRSRRPMAIYAYLELAVASVAALTPFLVDVVRVLYRAMGGTSTLGLTLGTVVRLLLSALVLGLPSVLMGGTLPAVAKVVSADSDPRRRSLAILYACNTAGAVVGTLLATFLLLEVLGTRLTLWSACLVNALVAMVARRMANAAQPVLQDAHDAPPSTAEFRLPPPAWALMAAFGAGMAFLLMELVWYRMLAPLLGGSTYTFGLILAVALLGMGLGSAAYALSDPKQPATVAGFALTCASEAVFVALPLALGDTIAVFAQQVRGLAGLGFAGQLVAWTLVTCMVVLPPAFAAGVQFPLLMGLLGRGGKDVGRQVGLAYAWNTAGAIAGSLSGGFGLVPLLGAVGCWRAVATLLAGMAVVSAWVGLGIERFSRFIPAVVLAGVALVMSRADGPSAAWRHGSIGAGRAEISSASTNGVMAWLRSVRAGVVREWEGVESAVALQVQSGFAFVVNGKVDGNARSDAGTQVMGGLMGALLHPRPRDALVVGLGTGSSAGWLGRVPSMERVDVLELEPAILDFAEACSPVNADMMNNPKVHVQVGDAREVLTTTRKHYDVIFSEPSNPYRAGIASLFTQEFYASASRRLRDGGFFLQWLQSYEVDTSTVRTVYATLASVFPVISTWQTNAGTDLLLIASHAPRVLDATALRARVASQPFADALMAAWRVNDLEGVLAHFVAGPSLAQAIAEQEGPWLSTDDQMVVEFGFARSVGKRAGTSVMQQMEAVAHLRGEDRPPVVHGDVNWDRVDDQRVSMLTMLGRPVPWVAWRHEDQHRRVMAHRLYTEGQLDQAARVWRDLGRPPSDTVELAMMADAMADVMDDTAGALIERLRALQPVEADYALARLRWRQQRYEEAAQALEKALQALRRDPWPWPLMMERALELVATLSEAEPLLGARMLALLERPFAVGLLEHLRQKRRAELADRVEFPSRCVAAWDELEPHVPWDRAALLMRTRCYVATLDQRAELAAEELDQLTAGEPAPFARGLVHSMPP
jgi:spermidine synthase/MFS family permease